MSSRTVDTHVAVLRRKLGHPMEEPGFIMTVAKGGRSAAGVHALVA